MAQRYEVQHFTILDGWVNTWTDTPLDEEPTPTTFATEDAARDALAEFLLETEGYTADEFRVYPSIRLTGEDK